MTLLGRIDMDSYWPLQSEGNIFTYGKLGDITGLRRAASAATAICFTTATTSWKSTWQPVWSCRATCSWRTPNPTRGANAAGVTFANPSAWKATPAPTTTCSWNGRRSTISIRPGPGASACFKCNPSETATFALGLFHNGISGSDFEAGDGANGSVTGRLTMAPILEDDGRHLLHLGVALSERIPEDGVATFNQHPQSAVLDPSDSTLSPFVPEIKIPSHFVQLFNLQLATCNGPFWTQCEWYAAVVPQIDAGTVFFYGYYVSTGYFLTGENRAVSPRVWRAGTRRRPTTRCCAAPKGAANRAAGEPGS